MQRAGAFVEWVFDRDLSSNTPFPCQSELDFDGRTGDRRDGPEGVGLLTKEAAAEAWRTPSGWTVLEHGWLKFAECRPVGVDDQETTRLLIGDGEPGLGWVRRDV